MNTNLYETKCDACEKIPQVFYSIDNETWFCKKCCKNLIKKEKEQGNLIKKKQIMKKTQIDVAGEICDNFCTSLETFYTGIQEICPIPEREMIEHKKEVKESMIKVCEELGIKYTN